MVQQKPLKTLDSTDAARERGWAASVHMPAKPVATVCLCNLENGHPERTPQNFSAAENLENGHPERTLSAAENLENEHPERTRQNFVARRKS